MTRALEGRLARLETKRRMHDDDLTRLSNEELNARIETLTLQIVAEHGGIESAIQAMGPDPICRPIVEALEQRLAAQTQAAP